MAQTIKKFGVPLEVIMRREDTLRVPKFFSECLEVVVKNADSEGFYFILFLSLLLFFLSFLFNIFFFLFSFIILILLLVIPLL